MAYPEEVPTVLHNSLRLNGGTHPWVSASGLEGVTDLEVQLSASTEPEMVYSVTLYFSELDEKTRPGERIFDVAVQGETIRKNLDIVDETGSCMKEIIIKAPSVKIKDKVLRISLTPLPGSKKPLLNGIHIERIPGRI